MQRVKQFGSSLHNISKKRQAEMASGTWKPKPRKALAQMSKKTASEWNKARNACFAIYGRRCFLCGQQYGELHCHHWQAKRTQRPDLKYCVDNLCVLCVHCHNKAHETKESYDEYKKKILAKIIQTGIRVRILEATPKTF